MDRQNRCKRDYRTTKLPTLRASAIIPQKANLIVRLLYLFFFFCRSLADLACKRLLLTPKPEPDLPTRGEILLKLYDQTCQTWRELIGVRFKLLALVPAASILALAAMFSSQGPGQGLTPFQRIVIAAVGLVVTLGLLVYDLRNSALHDDLISRGRRIEYELGIGTGIFYGRLKGSGLINHSLATTLIYGASIVAWAAIIAHASLR